MTRSIKPPIETRTKPASVNFAKVGVLASKVIEHIDDGDTKETSTHQKSIEVKPDENLNLFTLDKRIRRTLKDNKESLELYKSAVRAVMASYSLITPYSPSEVVNVEKQTTRAERDNVEEKRYVVSQYVEVARRFVDLITKETAVEVVEQVCPECEQPLQDRGDILWCSDCLIVAGQKLETETTLTEASSRNINDKLNHFRLIPQLFQGTEQYDVRTEDIEKIEMYTERYDICLETVAKRTLTDILEKTGLIEELGDHINLLHYIITGVKPPDISHIEERILARHQELLIAYSRIKASERKYPLKPWYLFYQYLSMEEYEVDPDELPLIKIKETLVWHNQMMKRLCNMLSEQGSRFSWTAIEMSY